MAYSAQDPYAAPQQPLLAQPIYPSYQTAPVVMVENSRHHHHHDRPPYDYVTAMLMCSIPAVLCGCCGCHQMYLGNTGIGICQCLTLGGCGVWSLIDAISMRQIVDEANRREGYFGDCQPGMVPGYVQAPQAVYSYAPLPPGTVMAQPQAAYPPQPQAAYPPQPQGPYPGQPGMVYPAPAQPVYYT